MSLYAKFMKEILNNKRDWKEVEIVVLTKGCSAVIQRNLPEKLQDPRSFVIPCTIGKNLIRKALYDLGASIHLMLLSWVRNFQIEEVNPTRICLQLAERSIKFLFGVVEDLLLKGKLTLRDTEDKVVLNVLEALQHPSDSKGCMRVDIIEPLIQEVFEVDELDGDLDSSWFT
ncbi:uncharacterized protein LOC107648537 [Arachis ipaensis]|uniref:uncharacterized protein LOC107648537 n=1 Tax=Arachis ipaensis TaxID=130454 RepID=UPI0007AF30C1|nr:uncharacterized protein LOC107648537 [Arachis ipaensis]